MSDLFDPPRWPGGPHICIETNLPALPSRKELVDWLERNAPGVHIDRIGKCGTCGEWHAATTAREPGGNSSGSGRYNKHKDDSRDSSNLYGRVVAGPLTPEEMAETERVSEFVFRRARRKGLKHGIGMKDESSYDVRSEIHCTGAEPFCARYLGIPWSGLNQTIKEDREQGDLGNGRQVRHTVLPYGKLVIRPGDNPEHTYFLVTGIYPNYVIRGWLLAKDGMKDKWWDVLEKGRPKCWAVPQSELHAPHTYKVE